MNGSLAVQNDIVRRCVSVCEDVYGCLMREEKKKRRESERREKSSQREDDGRGVGRSPNFCGR